MKRAALSLVLAASTSCLCSVRGRAKSSEGPASACHVEKVNFDGWKAERLTNRWVTLTVVPQLGGRLIQVAFGDHAYLFVNPQYRGKYFPPQSGPSARQWINYGGDKIWPMPEGTRDEAHWAGPVSGPLDDGAYALSATSRGEDCSVHLTGPPDPQTGLQYSREIRIGSRSPEIFFHAVMKNITAHPLRWSMQSVSQYDTSDPHEPSEYNRDFRAFTLANPASVYLNGYHVRDGPGQDPSFSVQNGIFRLHWLYLQSEVWIDSPGDWVAVVDGSTQYAMIERFQPDPRAAYPGKATVIFYSNGPALQLNEHGMPEMSSADPVHVPYYMEAELNSPLTDLKPGGSYSMDTEWLPTRLSGSVVAVTYAGAVSAPVAVSGTGSKLQLSGTFGVFFPGELVARLYDRDGVLLGEAPLQSVSPLHLVSLRQSIDVAPGTARVSIHLLDRDGLDRGSLGETWIGPSDESSN
ncbi:MAG TPA: hypothetical protein VGY31_09990 [Terriglobia bacterium]|nr:hypothetical protein [Terriglobia bacterium]